MKGRRLGGTSRCMDLCRDGNPPLATRHRTEPDALHGPFPDPPSRLVSLARCEAEVARHRWRGRGSAAVLRLSQSPQRRGPSARPRLWTSVLTLASGVRAEWIEHVREGMESEHGSMEASQPAWAVVQQDWPSDRRHPTFTRLGPSREPGAKGGWRWREVGWSDGRLDRS
nr:hypothetical protein CFP56_12966 [Quercus suber]